MLKIVLDWLVGKGLSLSVARMAVSALGVVLVLLGILALKMWYDHKIISKHDDKVNISVLQKQAPANDKAAEARASDTIILNNKAEERRDAIAKTSDEPPTDADVALNCRRLHQAGKDTTRIPACRGR